MMIRIGVLNRQCRNRLHAINMTHKSQNRFFLTGCDISVFSTVYEGSLFFSRKSYAILSQITAVTILKYYYYKLSLLFVVMGLCVRLVISNIVHRSYLDALQQ